MSIRVEKSDWRQKRWEWHGEAVYTDMQRTFELGEKFNVKTVAGLPALSHLAERTAYDIATAICRKLELRGQLERQGQLMYLVSNKSKRRRRVN